MKKFPFPTSRCIFIKRTLADASIHSGPLQNKAGHQNSRGEKIFSKIFAIFSRKVRNYARSKKLAKFSWINIFFSPTMINCGLACADVDNSSSVSSILQKHQNTTTPDHLLSQEFHLSRIFWAIFQSFSQKHQHIIAQGFQFFGKPDFPTLVSHYNLPYVNISKLLTCLTSTIIYDNFYQKS